MRVDDSKAAWVRRPKIFPTGATPGFLAFLLVLLSFASFAVGEPNEARKSPEAGRAAAGVTSRGAMVVTALPVGETDDGIRDRERDVPLDSLLRHFTFKKMAQSPSRCINTG